MSKRVYEIAKELGLSSREVIAALGGLGVVAKSHSSLVDDDIVLKLTDAQKSGQLAKITAAAPRVPAARPQRAPRPAAERPAAERAPVSARAPARKTTVVAEPPPTAPAVPTAKPAAAVEPAATEAATAVVEELKPLRVARGITVQEFAGKIRVRATDVVKRLFNLGEPRTVAQSMSDEAVELLGGEYGYAVTVVSPDEDVDEEPIGEEEDEALLETRPPVITVMGHVDHGKTLLLDRIRQTDVVAREHGGMTQHIGAYQAHRNDRAITFIDTPGHEAFTQMRARGAKVTDIAVLVVAADDGVKPQTVEALAHAKAAEVPVVVAVNKIDKPEADPVRVRQQLTEHELVPEEWGGKTVFVDISAKAGTNIDQLLEMLLLVADIQELKANPRSGARGVVIEAHLDKGRGPVATVLVQRGTLRQGDMLVAGSAWARVRAMLTDIGDQIKEAGPGTPAQVLGFNTVPEAGDEFRAYDDERRARQMAQERETKRRAADLVSRKRVTLEDLAVQAEEGEVTQLNIVLKADVQGSLEAIQDALEKLKIENVSVRVLHRAVGAISENDVSLAEASGAIVVGFNVRPDPKARQLAEARGVEIRAYQIIYKLIEEIEAALKGMMKPVFEENVTARAQVRQTFRVPKVGVVAGCYVEDGTINRNHKVRLVRDGVIVADTTIASLKRFKEDAREVAAGYECGVGLEGYSDIKEGDVLEFYEVRQIER